MDQLGRDLSGFFDFTPFKIWNGLSMPTVDVYETEKDVVVKAEIPGVTKDDLELTIDDEYIRISGQTKKDTEIKNETMYRSERYYGSFARTIPLPSPILTEQAKAEYKDGILSVTAPKAEPTPPKGRKVDIL
jgi:HSP20 family protein